MYYDYDHKRFIMCRYYTTARVKMFVVVVARKDLLLS